MDWVALNAVYMAHPNTIAKPATCSVRGSSVRRTCSSLARNGAREPCLMARLTLRLLHACDSLERGDPLLDRRMRVEQVIEEGAVMLARIVDHHRRDGVVEPLRWLVVLRDLLQRRDQALRIACQLDAAHVGKRFPLS